MCAVSNPLYLVYIIYGVVVKMPEQMDTSSSLSSSSSSSLSSNDILDIVTPSKRTSTIWKYFGFAHCRGKITKEKAVCKLCSKSVAHSSGTTNLRNHLLAWHKNEMFGEKRPQVQPMLTEFVRPSKIIVLPPTFDRANTLNSAIIDLKN